MRVFFNTESLNARATYFNDWILILDAENELIGLPIYQSHYVNSKFWKMNKLYDTKNL